MRIAAAIFLTCAAGAAPAQQSEIFIPGVTEPAAPPSMSIDGNPRSKLAACLANPSSENCTGLSLGRSATELESTAGPDAARVEYETLIFNPDETVTATEEPAVRPPDYTGTIVTDGPIELPSVAVTVEFDFDSAAIRADQSGKLAALIAALGDPYLAGTRFAVIGHTDASGSAAYNCDLSRRRALSVVATLQGNAVALPLVPIGFGEHVLKNLGDPRAAENRRVTFLRLPDDAGAVLQTAGAICGG